MLLSFTVVCRAELLTRCFIVELEQNAGSLKKNVSIKPDPHMFPGSSSEISETNDHTGSYLLSDKKRHRHDSYGIETTLIESISWQLLYATQLLVEYKLILSSKGFPISKNLYSRVPLDMVVAVGWFLKNYWNPDSPLFKSIARQELNHRHPFAIITAMFGSGENPPQYPPSKSSGQPASQAATQFTGSIASSLNSGSGGDNRDPLQHWHTLGLNCFVYPCHGVCRFQTLSDSSGSSEWTLGSLEGLCPHLVSGHCFICSCHFGPLNAKDSQQNLLFDASIGVPPIQRPFDFEPPLQTQGLSIDSDTANDYIFLDGVGLDGVAETTDFTGLMGDDVPMSGNLPCTTDDFEVINGPLDPVSLLEEIRIPLTLDHSETQQTITESAKLVESQPHLSQTGAIPSRNHSRQKTCNLTILGENGQPQACWKVCDNAKALSSHKSRYHIGQRICDLTMVDKGGQKRPCGKICKNARSLMDHKRIYHSGQQVCGFSVLGEDGQLRSCGKVCMNIKALSEHKSQYHSEQVSCELNVVGEDGQQRSCGKVCKSAKAFSDHKRREHSGQKTCDLIVIGEDGQQQPCGSVCNNAQAFSSHKSRYHTGQKTCDVTIADKEGQKRPCGKICKNTQALFDHIKINHILDQTCNVKVAGEDGQLRPCGRVCKNAKKLIAHKSIFHGEQKTCSVTLIGEDGQLRRCGVVCKNTRALSEHKQRHHTGQKTCNLSVMGKDGLQRPCGVVCSSVRRLSDHRRRNHSGQKTCDVIEFGENGLQQRCGKLCKNAIALTKHKRMHRKRKPVDVDKDLSP
ncbi:hypothetical protein [Endozoicomonas sp. 8E]|uniref:hypothetical protein n=1 Tax=Endozoicomonas sp. 8E TaxID=3035692 RepID=UPI00293909C0|nr:hypothetical protein [Endozoicomonas sp. 8E]WOG29015.1 hypothetical protein P6910_04955 [Endozoicomonas sp. 8E]